jgi:two-component system sensor histidine kinase SenX3
MEPGFAVQPTDPLVGSIIEVLREAVVVVDASGRAVFANPAARGMGLLDGDRLASDPLSELVRRVRRTGRSADGELDLPRERQGPLGVRASAVPVGGGFVALEIADVTDAHRVARVRRDFVANVSHELKTPVGALQLLAEALVHAVDDPVAAARFADRIQHESSRLGRLVGELIELSRLQGGDPLPESEPVPIDRVVNEVLDRSRTAAAAKQIDLDWEGRRDLVAFGVEAHLVTAIANLVDNAIAYSGPGTRVVIGTGGIDEVVEVSVADEGIGIPVDDIDRIFERFYRSDPARSRSTGGTGLGLAIVKHIATNHGGEVLVSSEVGEGSTFTLRLPTKEMT